MNSINHAIQPALWWLLLLVQREPGAPEGLNPFLWKPAHCLAHFSSNPLSFPQHPQCSQPEEGVAQCAMGVFLGKKKKKKVPCYLQNGKPCGRIVAEQTSWAFLQKTGSFCLTQCFPDAICHTCLFPPITFNSFSKSLQHLTKDWFECSVKMNPLTHKSCKSHGFPVINRKASSPAEHTRRLVGWGEMFGEQKCLSFSGVWQETWCGFVVMEYSVSSERDLVRLED